MFVGLDGCRQGWVCVAIDDVGFADASVHGTFDAARAAYRAAASIAVDMPIGLTDAGREADRAVRRFLVGQASSVFVTPPRAVLAATSNEEAQRLSRELTGKGVSKQSLALAKKIFEVEVHAADPRVHEVHPEVSFRLMKGDPLRRRKKTWGGVQERLALLRAQGIELPESIGEADGAGIDDVVDAAAAAWTARRIAAGAARCFPSPANQRDARGRTIAIWG